MFGKPTWIKLLLGLNLSGGLYGVIIEPPLVVFYVYGIFSRIDSLPRINFFGGGLSLMVVVCFVSMGLNIGTYL